MTNRSDASDVNNGSWYSEHQYGYLEPLAGCARCILVDLRPVGKPMRERPFLTYLVADPAGRSGGGGGIIRHDDCREGLGLCNQSQQKLKPDLARHSLSCESVKPDLKHNSKLDDGDVRHEPRGRTETDLVLSSPALIVGIREPRLCSPHLIRKGLLMLCPTACRYTSLLPDVEVPFGGQTIVVGRLACCSGTAMIMHPSMALQICSLQNHPLINRLSFSGKQLAWFECQATPMGSWKMSSLYFLHMAHPPIETGSLSCYRSTVRVGCREEIGKASHARYVML